MARSRSQPDAPACAWRGFTPGLWQREINVRDFIQQNYEPYYGRRARSSRRPTARTRGDLGDAERAVRRRAQEGRARHLARFPVRSRRTRPATSTASNEVIVGLQTDAPLKRAIMPNGGFRMVAQRARRPTAASPTRTSSRPSRKYRKTHNDAVFDAYTADIRRCRSSHILTGLPDAYGRGRIIGDYRRVALYGVARLIERKKQEKARARRRDVDRRRSSATARNWPSRSARCSELKQMAASYGFDISRPARDREGGRAVAVLRLPRRP